MYINFKQVTLIIFAGVLSLTAGSCKKGEKDPTELPGKETETPGDGPLATKKTIVYIVKGTRFRLNMIDSNSVFKRDLYFNDSLKYQFEKRAGSNVGISVFKQAIGDTITSWEIKVNGKVQANAASEGGAYFTVPY